MNPIRNKVKFIWKDRQQIYSICNDKIKRFIDNGEFNDSDLLEVQNSAYIVNGKIITGNYLLEKIEVADCSYQIVRNIRTFHQPDDNIRLALYNVLNQLLRKVDSITFLGGEMYIFGKIFPIREQYFYSDFESICLDTKNNLPEAQITLCDYNMVTLNHKTDTILINPSKQGLTENLCSEICRIGYQNLLIISCNYQSFLKDWKLLSKRYSMIKKFVFETNYRVYLIILIDQFNPIFVGKTISAFHY